MHEYTMNKIGCYIKDNYCPETMSHKDLEDLYLLSKIFKNILAGDKDYHIICSMEEGHNEEEMLSEEFLERFKKAYENMSPAEKKTIKEEVEEITE